MSQHTTDEAQACRVQPAVLIWREGDLVKDQWILDRSPMTIGRAIECDIHLDNRWISRLHARIVLRGNIYVLEDADSRNGVFVNGKLVSASRELRDGDRIQLAPGWELLFADSEATLPLPRRDRPDLIIDQPERAILVRGQPLSPPVSAAQHDFLALLTQEPGRVYSRTEVVAAVWPDVSPEGVSDDAIDALVRRLRQRLAEIDADREYIITVRGYGFKIDPGLRVERR